MKHLGMLQPWGYWRSKQFSLILPLTAAAAGPDYMQELDWESHRSHAPNSPGGIKDRKRTRALVDYAGGEAEGTVRDPFGQRESSVASCAV